MTDKQLRIPASMMVVGLIFTVLTAILRSSDLTIIHDKNLEWLFLVSLVSLAFSLIAFCVMAIWDNTPRPY